MKFTSGTGASSFEEIPGGGETLSRSAPVRASGGRSAVSAVRLGHRARHRLGHRHDPHDARARGWCASATRGSSSSATSRCWSRCSSGTSSSRSSSRRSRRGSSGPIPRMRSSCRRCSASGFSPRRGSPSRCAPASSRCRAASAYAGMALGLTQPQVYRYVLLPMALSHHHPAAHQRDDEPHQELVDRADASAWPSSRSARARWANTRSVSSRRSRAATRIYIVIAMTANRVMAVIERRVAVPGYIAGGK